MGKRNSRMSTKVRRWVSVADEVQVSNIDRKTFNSKKVLKKHIAKMKRSSANATNNIIINISGRQYMIKRAKSINSTCTECTFARHGRSSKHCPTIEHTLSSNHLCTTFGSGRIEYFSDITEELYV